MTVPAHHAPPRPGAVLFDCGGTLVHPDVGLVHAALTASGVRLPSGVDLAASLTRTVDMDKWELPDLRTADKFFDIWAFVSGIADERAPAIMRTVLHEQEVYAIVDPDAATTFAALRDRGLRVGVLANDDGELGSELTRFDLAHLVDVAVSSHEIGVRKPDPAAYSTAVDGLGMSPDDCWYVGDSLFNDYLGPLHAGFGAAYAYDRYDALGAVAVRRIRRLGQIVDEVDGVVTTG